MFLCTGKLFASTILFFKNGVSNMKNQLIEYAKNIIFIIALLFILTFQSMIEAREMEKSDFENVQLNDFYSKIDCTDLVDITVEAINNIKIYSIMCNDANGTRIYAFAPRQISMIYFIEK